MTYRSFSKAFLPLDWAEEQARIHSETAPTLEPNRFEQDPHGNTIDQREYRGNFATDAIRKMPETVWNGPPPYKTDPDSLEKIMRQRMYEQTPVPEGRTGRLAMNEAWRIFCRRKGQILDRQQWYIALTRNLNIPAPRESCDALFDRYDKDQDGKISQAEFRQHVMVRLIPLEKDMPKNPLFGTMTLKNLDAVRPRHSRIMHRQVTTHTRLTLSALCLAHCLCLHADLWTWV